MQMKRLGCFKYVLASVLWVVFLSKNDELAFAQGNSYFGENDIDYWREGKKVKPFVPGLQPQKAESPKPIPSGSIIRQSDALPFDWKNYDDPKSPEFWDDGGDYVAPRPLREAVANPTPENLEKYAAWQAKRLLVIAEFNAKLVAQSHAQNSPSKSSETSSQSISRQNTINKINLREVSLLYFYQSSCPHCQAEKEKVEDLKRKGVQVTFVQLDAGENVPLHIPSVPYSAALSKQFSITATPTWIFRRRANSMRLQGEQSEQDLFAQISELFRITKPSELSAFNDKGVPQ